MNVIIEEARAALWAVWNRRWLALGVAWGVCLLGWLAIALIPNSYESKARMFVQLDDMLAEDIRLQLSQYISEPLVTVIVNEFAGTFSQQIRVVGATEKPASLPYRANMTLLDAMIAVGGLSEFASGNRAKLIRFDKSLGRQREYALRLGDLLRDGESRATVMLAPGDVIIIPESMF